MSSGKLKYILELNTIIDTEGIDEASLLELKKVQDGHDENKGEFMKVNNRCALRARKSKRRFHYTHSDVGR
jgi:hypothetical protein